MKRSISLTVIALFILVLTSCLGIESVTTVASNGSVNMEINYLVPNALDEFGKIGSNADYLPLPLGRADIELAATRAGGQLISWNRTNNEKDFKIVAKLAFPNLDSFGKFLDPELKLIQVNERSISLELASGTPTQDTRLIEFIKSAFGDYSISIELNLPSNAVNPSGFSGTGKTLRYSEKTSNIFSSNEKIVLSTSW